MLVVPPELQADVGPFRIIQPKGEFTDPEVPDTRMPPRVYIGQNRNGTIEDVARRPVVPLPQAVRPENWYEKVLRILRSVALGGRVR